MGNSFLILFLSSSIILTLKGQSQGHFVSSTIADIDQGVDPFATGCWGGFSLSPSQWVSGHEKSPRCLSARWARFTVWAKSKMAAIGHYEI